MATNYYDDGSVQKTYDETISGSPPLIPDVYLSSDPSHTDFLTTAGLTSNISGFGSFIDDAFFQYIQTPSPNRAPDYGSFLGRVALWNTTNTPQIDVNALNEAFFDRYMSTLGSGNTATIDAQGNITGITGDLSILSNDPVFLTNLKNGFYSAMDNFINTFDIGRLVPPAAFNSTDKANNFLDDFQSKFEKTVASIQSNEILSSFSQPALTTYLASYESVYNGFTEDPTLQGFLSTLKSFANSQPGQSFNPSLDFPEWVKQFIPDPVTGFSKLQGPDFLITGSSLDGNNSDSVLIINRILALLIKMISTLQKVGIAQAQHLTFTTNYQKAYTALQGEIPTFTLGKTGPNGKPLIISSDPKNQDQSNARNEINATINGSLGDNIRSLNSLQQDSAKQQQSNINQTNDAVNSQTDMATTFIQQLNTLLSSVLR